MRRQRKNVGRLRHMLHVACRVLQVALVWCCVFRVAIGCCERRVSRTVQTCFKGALPACAARWMLSASAECLVRHVEAPLIASAEPSLAGASSGGGSARCAGCAGIERNQCAGVKQLLVVELGAGDAAQ
jgi:hypothetical protein